MRVRFSLFLNKFGAFFNLFTFLHKNTINLSPGNYCEGATPDPIPNSEVKSFSADGTIS